ncbi:MAG: hypothetical protein ACD_30C00025G0002 [uncultured bacterium]|nr:MAG: hypothetical protein ACD_30C00025G0002 [uncultured bacterium]
MVEADGWWEAKASFIKTSPKLANSEANFWSQSSSPASNLRFSRMCSLPSGSLMWPKPSSNHLTIGLTVKSGSSPWGLPMWPMSMTDCAWSKQNPKVSMPARSLKSSTTLPFSIGTSRSSLNKTFLPEIRASSKSFI